MEKSDLFSSAESCAHLFCPHYENLFFWSSQHKILILFLCSGPIITSIRGMSFLQWLVLFSLLLSASSARPAVQSINAKNAREHPFSLVSGVDGPTLLGSLEKLMAMLSLVEPQNGTANHVISLLYSGVTSLTSSVPANAAALGSTGQATAAVKEFILWSNITIMNLIRLSDNFCGNTNNATREAYAALFAQILAQHDAAVNVVNASIAHARFGLHSWELLQEARDFMAQELMMCGGLPSQQELEKDITEDKAQLKNCTLSSCISFWKQQWDMHTDLLNARILCGNFGDLPSSLLQNLGLVINGMTDLVAMQLYSIQSVVLQANERLHERGIGDFFFPVLMKAMMLEYAAEMPTVNVLQSNIEILQASIGW